MTDVTSTTLVLAALMNLRGVGRKQALRAVPKALAEDAHVADETRRVAAAFGHDGTAVDEAVARTYERQCAGSQAGVAAIGIHDAAYPSRLRHMPDPPAVLYVKGNALSLAAAASVAVVGTREPTEYGCKVARKLAFRLAEAGYVIVSGLAHGCDTLGHEGCLDAPGIGVAVMAHGLDRVYPAANRGLAERLLARNGCLVSEYAFGVTPARAAFAERDRIQSGLSDAVLVVETGVKGGTMHTVRFARAQRRALACIDHPERWRGEEKVQGNRMLIADGWATPIPDGETLMDFMGKVTATGHPTPSVPSFASQHALAL